MSSDHFAGVELLLEEAKPCYNLTILQKKGGQLELVEQAERLDWESLCEKLSQDIPVHLTISGRGILHRKVERSTFGSEGQLLEMILPNANLDTFYLQSVLVGDYCFASVVRKQVVADVLMQWQEKEYWILQLSLGAFDVRFLTPFFKQKNTFYTQKQILEFDQNEKLQSFASNAEGVNAEINLGEDRFGGNLLVSYAGAFKGLMKIDTGLVVEQTEQIREEFLHRNVYTKGSLVVLFGLLFILLVNTGMYYHYKSSNQRLSTDLMYKKAQLEELDALRNQFKRQQSFLQNTNINQGSRASYYADQIGASLPEGLQLQGMTLFPLKGKAKDYREDDLLVFVPNKIILEGLCKSSLLYNEWIKTLEKESWISKVRHLEYRDLSNQLGAFDLELTLATE